MANSADVTILLKNKESGGVYEVAKWTFTDLVLQTLESSTRFEKVAELIELYTNTLQRAKVIEKDVTSINLITDNKC